MPTNNPTKQFISGSYAFISFVGERKKRQLNVRTEQRIALASYDSSKAYANMQSIDVVRCIDNRNSFIRNFCPALCLCIMHKFAFYC